MSPEGKKLIKEYRDWEMTPDVVYIRIAGSTKPPHWFPHFVPDTLFLQEMAYQTSVNGVDIYLHRKKKIFGLHFHFQPKFERLKVSNMPKMKLVYLPPINLEKLLSEDMIPREN